MSVTLIDLMIKNRVLQLGDFTLKSGMKSSVFFNFGRINSAQDLSQLGSLYAERLCQLDWPLTRLVGPAYKGIPIATATALRLVDADVSERYRSVKVVYNRKEAKQHGEGGAWVGDLADQQVVLVDDVLTAGTALKTAVEAVQVAGAHLSGIIVALDRQVVDAEGQTTAQRLAKSWSIPVESLLSLDQMIAYYQTKQDLETVSALQSTQMMTIS